MAEAYAPTLMSRQHSMIQQWKPRQVFSYPHAILSTDGEVLAIRSYPKITRSNAVVPIPDGAKVRPGWFWNRSTNTFEKEPHNA